MTKRCAGCRKKDDLRDSGFFGWLCRSCWDRLMASVARDF